MRRIAFRAGSLCLAASLAVAGGVAIAEPTLSPGRRFSEQGGEALYANACQACHMSHGEGAVGAGRYPSLASNQTLETAPYAIYVALHGQRAMPPVGRLMTDEQVAEVINYIRTHFGNSYKDVVTAGQVRDAR